MLLRDQETNLSRLEEDKRDKVSLCLSTLHSKIKLAFVNTCLPGKLPLLSHCGLEPYLIL